MNPTNPYGDGNAPKSNDDIGITLRKILAETILMTQGGGAGSLYVPFSVAPTSSTPGVAGNYGSLDGFYYIYDGTAWWSVPLNAVS